MPQEIEVWYIIPAIRRELAKSMKKLGIKQKKIAEILGVTNAAVSQYLKEKRAKDFPIDGKTKKMIDECAKKLSKGESCPIKGIQDICNYIEKKGGLCDLHKKYSLICEKCKMR